MKKNYILWGTGLYGGYCLEYMKRENIGVKALVDSDPHKIGGSSYDIPIISPTEYKSRYGEMPVLVATLHSFGEISNANSDIKMRSFDDWYFEREASHLSSLEFNDEKSYRTLDTLIKSKRNADVSILFDVIENNQYFSVPGFSNTKEWFVDCGACTGDSIERFMLQGVIGHVWAFEPEQRAYEAMKIRVDRLKQEWCLDSADFDLIQGAVGEKSGVVGWNEGQAISQGRCTNNGTKEVKIYALDEYLSGEKVTFIKADIEGKEYDMLLGAVKLISEQKPKLAICVYHRPDDLLRIYSLLKSLRGDYRFSLRHHSPNYCETVLYAY